MGFGVCDPKSSLSNKKASLNARLFYWECKVYGVTDPTPRLFSALIAVD